MRAYTAYSSVVARIMNKITLLTPVLFTLGVVTTPVLAQSGNDWMRWQEAKDPAYIQASSYVASGNSSDLAANRASNPVQYDQDTQNYGLEPGKYCRELAPRSGKDTLITTFLHDGCRYSVYGNGTDDYTIRTCT